MSIEFNDWSAHLMQAERETKAAGDCLLHNRYNEVATHIHAAKEALDKTLAWMATHGSNAGVDILPMLQNLLDGSPSKDPSRPYITAAIQEIQQLRGERQFWLKSGYDIGSKS